MTAPPQTSEVTEVTVPTAARTDRSVIGGLLALAEALATLDGTDPDIDSITFDRVTDRLITPPATR